MPSTKFDHSKFIEITDSPEAGAFIVTFRVGTGERNARIAMHADGMLYEYRPTNNGWEADFVLGRMDGKKTFSPRDAAWHLELLAERRYGKQLIAIKPD